LGTSLALGFHRLVKPFRLTFVATFAASPSSVRAPEVAIILLGLLLCFRIPLPPALCTVNTLALLRHAGLTDLGLVPRVSAVLVGTVAWVTFLVNIPLFFLVSNEGIEGSC